MDEYYVVNILGSGGEGQVLLAQHKKTHEEFAIKLMEWRSLKDANLRLQEVDLLKQFDHKNILRYHGVFLHKYSEESQFVCICMEYCPGGDLQRVISQAWNQDPMKPMNEDDILRYTREIAEGLDFLHGRNIIHRDLKPQNILVSKDGSLKIGDFGISKEIGASLPKTQCGTPCYMSWEMLNDEAYDEMTDMYSLGIILLQFLTGKAMMMSVEMNRNPGFFSTLEKELTRKYNYSPELIRLARKLVNVSPSDRPSAREVIKVVKEIQTMRRKSEVMLITRFPPSHSAFTTELKLIIFSFLDIPDMYQVALVCKNFYTLWDTKWWDMFAQTKKGSKMIESVSTDSVESGYSPSSSRVRRSSTIGEQSSHTSASSIFETIGVNSVISHALQTASSFSHEPEKKKPKELLFTYFKIHRPQMKRARRNMGKRIVAELHPSQIRDAAEFLAKTFKTSHSDWFRYTFDLTPVEEEIVDSYPKVTTAVTPATEFIKSSDQGTEINPSSIFINGLMERSINNNERPVNTNKTNTSSVPNATAKPVYKVSDAKFQQMMWFFICVIRYGLKHGRVWVSTFYYNKLFVREIQGISIWLHPYNSKNLSFWKMLRVGILYAPQNMGLGSFTKLLRVLSCSEKVHANALDQSIKPHWTLFLLTVKPGMNNNGIGSSLLLPVLKSADEQSIPIYTTVYSPTIELLKFYKRHGFDIAEKVEKPKAGPPFYSMIRYSQ
jgi:serine/threonine protein kinase